MPRGLSCFFYALSIHSRNSQTCKRLSHLTKLRIIWYRRFSAEVLEKHLPIPGPFLSVHDIPSNDLEWRTRRALQLDKCWQSPSRHALSHAPLQGLDSEDVQKVILLYGTSSILAVLSNKLQLWEVDLFACRPQRVARLGGEWISSNLVAVQRDTFYSNHIAAQCVVPLTYPHAN